MKTVVADHQKRLVPIEYALYKSKNPSDAFESIHRKIAETERTRIE